MESARVLTPTTTERASFVLGCVGVAGFWLAIGWPLLVGEVYTDTDLGNFHLPMRFFYAEALERGFDFHWFPYAYTGFHLHGEGQASLYHPLNWLMYRWLPLDVAFVLDILRNYVLLAVGMGLFLHRRGARRDAAVLGAALLAFGSFATMHFMHLNAMAIVAHLPWLLLAIDVALRSPHPGHAALAMVAVAAMTASQLLFGHPQFVWLSLVAEGAFALFVLWQGAAPRRWPWLLAAALLAFPMAAVQMIPQWESLGRSQRAEPFEHFAYTLSLAPENLVQIVSPLFFRARAVGGAEATEFAVYGGALVPVLLGWVLARRRGFGRVAPALWASLAFALLALLMALGDRGPVYWIQAMLPGVGLFRGPARYILLAQLGLAIGATIAFADLARFSERRAVVRAGGDATDGPGEVDLRCLALPVAVAVGVFALGLARPFAETVAREVSGPVRLGYGVAGVVLFSGLVWAAARGHRWVLPVVVGLALLDLGVYGMAWMRRDEPVALETFVERRRVPDWTDRWRMHWGPQALTMRHVRLVSGYAAMVPSRRLHTDRYELGNRPPSPDMIAALRVAGVGWAYGRPIPDPLPRVRLVGGSVRAHGIHEQLLAIDLRRTAIVHGEVALDGGEPGDVLVLDDVPGALRVETSAPGRQLLVFAESHHPGWRARVDGEAAEVLRVYGDFMGVVVPGGVHEVALRFAPESVRIGRLVSLGGCALLVPLYLGARRAGRVAGSAGGAAGSQSS